MARGPVADEAPLGDAEIEALLAAEATGLPPESHQAAPPLQLAEREPGRGLGRWPVWILLAVVAVMVVDALLKLGA
jgi:hypothetical protein